jgi:hypothetical protein
MDPSTEAAFNWPEAAAFLGLVIEQILRTVE